MVTLIRHTLHYHIPDVCFVLQVARRSLHRPPAVLYLSTLQVLDGITVTLEERTRAELLNNEAQVPQHLL